MGCRFSFPVNGFQVDATYHEDTIQNIFLPLLKVLTAQQKKHPGRMLVLLAAPPGAGKSTLGHLLCHLSKEVPGLCPMQALGLDGFHYANSYLQAHTRPSDGRTLKQIKGAPETYDFPRLMSHVQNLSTTNSPWPIYDRNLHDPVDHAIPITHSIILLEGNWLLLNEDPWRKLAPLADYRILIQAEPNNLQRRLVDRKIRGGLAPEAGEQFYLTSDLPNIQRMMGAALPADLTLRLTADGDYVKA